MYSSAHTKNIFFAVILGLFSGTIIAVFFKSLFWIQNFQQNNSHYILLLPIVFLILKLFKKQSLYFPVSVSEVYSATAANQKYWSRGGLFFNFIGSTLSHFSGASIGREGVAITMSASLVQLLKLDWNYWRPIIMSAAFGIAIGHPIVGFVFMYEVFSTNWDQKIWGLLMTWTGCLVIQTLQVPHLIEPFLVLDINSTTDKFVFSIAAAAMIGLLSRLYKSQFFSLKQRFDRTSLWILLPLIFIASGILFLPQFKDLHSLSLNQFQMLQSGQVSIEFLIYKFLFTLFFVAIGFWGGDFVPSVLIGSGFGIYLAHFFGVDPKFGLMVGAFSFFCGLTRLKWTAFVMAAFLVGFQHLLWIYLFLTVSRWFAGTASVYTTEPSTY
jgi:H+/Cl- antiporter ClcA